ncbi:hypothetical protein [Methylobacterium brachythecii]|uniref:Uncharacterized protein n=1 Tax=Methylobacterium brachythecii TaxID=1176177 RepID=A0A7W6AM59_9HYPH|nr:hypothetical protein [Methylobacterium brachythecii]MBB3905156.1 hypothetical protein [Methylobacterium brachythecii]GLS44337.1 hypothetical protein GCM10007884_23250 [Methylobacterium brachythecii]
MALVLVAFLCGVIVRTWRQIFIGVAIIWLMVSAWNVVTVASVVSTTSVPNPSGGFAQVAGYLTAELLIMATELLFADTIGHAIRAALSSGRQKPPPDAETV